MARPEGKYAWTVTVGTKGQIVIPAEARELFGIRPGDTLLVLGDEKQGLAIPRKNLIMSMFSHVFGNGRNSAETEEEEE